MDIFVTKSSIIHPPLSPSQAWQLCTQKYKLIWNNKQEGQVFYAPASFFLQSSVQGPNLIVIYDI